MTPRPDDELDDEEALRWEGDEQLGRASAGVRAGARSPGIAGEGDLAEDDAWSTGAEDTGAEDSDDARDLLVQPRRRAATIGAGFLYLAITVGWILSVQYTSSGSTSALVEIPWQFGEFMALAAAPLTFVAIRELMAAQPMRRMVLAWLVGAALIIPWPIIILLSRGVA